MNKVIIKKEALLSVLFILTLFLFVSCTISNDAIKSETNNELNVKVDLPDTTQKTEEVDILKISLEDCLQDIRVTNPSMTDETAKNNCYSLEAMKQNDINICQKVTVDFKSICENQFK